MEYWEFLLQKEGDRSWLPLESTNAEILEGRYRVMARSNRVNTPVEIRIIYQLPDEVPPKRRVQKRSNRTNADGLMVVIPFTTLKPGVWQLRCAGDVMTDFLGEPWQHSLQLQVSPHDVELEDWEPSWQDASASVLNGSSIQDAGSTGSLNSTVVLPDSDSTLDPEPISESIASAPMPRSELNLEIGQAIGSSMERFLEVAEQMSQQLVEQVLQEFDLDGDADEVISDQISSSEQPTQSSAFEISDPDGLAIPDGMSLEAEPFSETAPSVPSLVEPAAIALTLEQETYVARRGESLTLKGQVGLVAAATNRSNLSINGRTIELQVLLRDPQSAQVLVNMRQSLPTQALPFPFACLVTIPPDFTTRLMLGEVILHDVTPASPAANSPSLATQSFIVTADLDELLGTLAQLNEVLTHDLTQEPDLLLDPAKVAQEQLESTYLKLSFLTPQAEPEPQQLVRFPSLAGQPLPPKLYQPDPAQAGSKPLDLPAFNKTDASVASNLDQDLDKAAEPEQLTSNRFNQSEQPGLVDGELVGQLGIDSNHANDANNSVNELTSPKSDQAVSIDPFSSDSTFQSLKIRDRFWARLNSLATDAELSEWLKINLPNSATTSTHLSPKIALTGLDADLASREVVVDDEPIAAKTPSKDLSQSRSAKSELVTSPLPEDDPVPTPVLEIADGELVAGKPITIRVKLPQRTPRVYVKLWVNDCQTRLMLDGPRWLVDFLPNGLGELEAMSQLTVPFGSLEIRFEAIALEMQTQRESHKVTVTRPVIPPDLPNLSLDEFNP